MDKDSIIQKIQGCINKAKPTSIIKSPIFPYIVIILVAVLSSYFTLLLSKDNTQYNALNNLTIDHNSSYIGGDSIAVDINTKQEQLIIWRKLPLETRKQSRVEGMV